MTGSFIRRFAAGAGLATCLSACGPPTADLTTADGVKSWAGGSATAVYATALSAFNPSSMMMDPSCPKVTTSGSVQTYTGGCTDTSGVKWIGTAAVDGAMGMQARAVKLTGFGRTSQVTCQGAQASNTQTSDGTTTTTDGGAGMVNFQVDLKTQYDRPSIVDCSRESGTSTLSYAGSYANNGMDPTTWNGSGEVGDSARGQVHAATINEVLDQAMCKSEALSGTTTLTAEGHTAVIVYDGAKNCEMASTVTWTLDGVPKGVISGIACSAGPAPGGDEGSAWAALPIGALALACVSRLRRRRARTPASP